MNIVFSEPYPLLPLGSTSFQFAYVLSEDGLAPYLAESDAMYIISPVDTIVGPVCDIVIEIMKPVVLVQVYLLFNGNMQQVCGIFCVLLIWNLT